MLIARIGALEHHRAGAAVSTVHNSGAKPEQAVCGRRTVYLGAVMQISRVGPSSQAAAL